MNRVDLIIENAQNDILVDEKLEKIISDVVAAVLDEEDFNKAVEISVTFVNNERIKEINREHRNKDVATDVLSFPMLEFDEIGKINSDYHMGDYNYDEDVLMLGDIVISLEKAKQQADEYGHSFEREIGFLTAHSMFHLLGYDHETPQEEETMRSKEELVLQKLGLKR